MKRACSRTNHSRHMMDSGSLQQISSIEQHLSVRFPLLLEAAVTVCGSYQLYVHIICVPHPVFAVTMLAFMSFVLYAAGAADEDWIAGGWG